MPSLPGSPGHVRVYHDMRRCCTAVLGDALMMKQRDYSIGRQPGLTFDISTHRFGQLSCGW